jgi:hypothetical protein
MYGYIEMDVDMEEEKRCKIKSSKRRQNNDKPQNPESSQSKTAKHEERHRWYVSDDEE